MKKIINYSGIPVLVLIATLAFMPISCSKEAVKDNPEADNSSQLIKISGEDANAATKTILVNFATLWIGGTDQVGVYCAESTGGKVNIPYTASSTAFSSAFTGAMKWGTGTHNFYAYYPYLAGNAAAGVVPISLTASQTQSAGNSSSHLSTLDFMVATPVSQEPGSLGASTSVNLRYNHVFTVLEFQIVGTGTLKAVKLVVPTNPIAFSGGTIDITQPTPETGTYTITGTTTEVVVTLGTSAPLSATDTKVYMVINPGTQAGYCLIGLSTNGTTWTYISKAAPDGGFLRGKKYVVSVDAASATDPVVDVDGNIYTTVTIGSQVWMGSNLKTTKYNDGSAITNITVDGTWYSATAGAWCDYNNTSSNSTTYGKLYNWYAVNTGKLCPTGWHVPTGTDWSTLATVLGSSAGDKLKETGTTHWISNTAATNSSGFTALPGGRRSLDGTFGYNGTNGFWWTSTIYVTNFAYYKSIETSYLSGAWDNYKVGNSVRCVKD